MAGLQIGGSVPKYAFWHHATSSSHVCEFPEMMKWKSERKEMKEEVCKNKRDAETHP